jgi:hypothetical protein
MEKDKELDNLFKRGFDDPVNQPDFRQDDWDDMESMLDGDKKRVGTVYWLPRLGTVAAMLLVAFGLWMFTHKTPENHSVVKIRISTKDTSDLKERHPGTSDGSIQRNERIYASTRKDTITPAAPSTTHSSAISSATLAANTSYRQKGQPTVTPSAGGSRRDITGRTDEQLSASHTDIQQVLTLLSVKPSLNSSKHNPDTIAPADLTSKQNYGVAALNRVKARAISSYKPQLAITVLGSSDLNGVNSFSQTKVGTNVGAIFSLGLSKRLTISTGAIYSSKPYLTNFDNYQWSSKFPSTPTSVSADCRMIDVPLNLDYSLYAKHGNKFSVGTGISSYLMFHENYSYGYANGGNGPAAYNVPNPGKYYLSIMNLQATYQRRINAKMGLDIQPYMKLPLSGVGLYNSRLQSTGVAVGVTWNLRNH